MPWRSRPSPMPLAIVHGLHFALAEILALAARKAPAKAEAAAARKLLRQKGATALLELHRAPVLARR